MVFITNNIREKWKWGIAQLCPVYDSFFSFLIQMMYTEHLFVWRKDCGLVVQHSDRYFNIFREEKIQSHKETSWISFLFLTKFIAGSLRPTSAQVFSCIFDSWAIFSRASLLKFLSLSVFPLMVSELTSLCLFCWCTESVCTRLSLSYQEWSSHSMNILHLTFFCGLN